MLSLQGPIPVKPVGNHERFRPFILIDEAKILTMGEADTDGRDLILNIMVTEGRKFGIGLIPASQMRDHFGRDVKGNVGTNLVFRAMDHSEAKINAREIGVQPSELLSLQGYGEGDFRSGHASRAVKIQVDQLSV